MGLTFTSMYSEYRVPLQVYILWQPKLSSDSEDISTGAELARSLFKVLCRDIDEPLQRGIGVPTYFRSVVDPVREMPPDINLDAAERVCVVALIDSEMVIDSRWHTYLTSLKNRITTSNGRQRFLPVALESSAIGYAPARERSCVRYDLQGTGAPTYLAISVLHELCRLLAEIVDTDLPSKPVKIFISHAKKDGLEQAKGLKSRIENTHADRFFDAVDIAPGFEFAREIESGIDSSTVILLLTDLYSTRPWCLKEVLLAKERRRPVIVVDALVNEELRSFPYAGNARVLRWTDNVENIVLAALSETLRFDYQKQRMDQLVHIGRFPSGACHLLRAPELLDVLEYAIPGPNGSKTPVVYPDPPLGIEELALLESRCLGADFLTASSPWPEPNLIGKRIGISISDAPDLAMYGLGPGHLVDATFEIARNLLAFGAQLAYGGDLRKKGFTEHLLDLAYSFNRELNPALLTNYEAWNVHTFGDRQRLAEIMHDLTVRLLPLPDDLNEILQHMPTALDIQRLEHRYLAARCYTEMRRTMQSEIDAQIFVGGAIFKYNGIMPGLLEEFLIAFNSGLPVFLIGGFGGCAKVLVDAIGGKKPPALTLDFQLAHNPGYSTFYPYYQEFAKPYGVPAVNYEEATTKLERVGISGLNNGLDEQENAKLMTTVDLDAVNFLILQGLSRLFSTAT